MTRRRFGSITKKKSSNGNVYYEAHYLAPKNMRSTPNMPKRITKRFPEGFELQAEKWLADIEASIRLGTWQSPTEERSAHKTATTTFADYAVKWVESRHKPDGTPIRETTKQKYRESIRIHLLPTFGGKLLSSITAKDVEQWYNDFPLSQDGFGVGARRNAYKTLKALLNSAATTPIDDEGHTLIVKSPALLKTATFRPKHTSVIAEVHELELLRTAMPGNLAIAVPLAGYLGLREGECLGLQRRDIDFGSKILHVRHAVKPIYDEGGHRTLILGEPKSVASVRDLAIPPFMENLLRLHMSKYTGERPEDLLITGARDRSFVAPQSFRNAFERARVTVPVLKDMRFHDLRHTALTRLAEMGATNGELMAQAGHTSLEIASIYQQTSNTHKQEVMDRLDDTVRKTSEPSQEATETINIVEELEKLVRLRNQGILDDDEFKVIKMKLMSRI